MRTTIASRLIPLLLILLFAFTIRKSPPDGWVKLSRFDHQNDSFLLAPVSYYYKWEIRRDTNGVFYSLFDKPLTAQDTTGWARNAHILMDRKGDYPSTFMNDRIGIRKTANDTLELTIWLGDGEWFAKYVVRVCGKYHKGGCEPGYPGAAQSYIEDSLHYKTTKQLLQLDRTKYQAGDSIKGFIDCSFDMGRTPSHMDQLLRGDKPWKADIRLVGTFKGIVLCDTCSL